MSLITLSSGQALHVWRDVAFSLVIDGDKDLTQRQTAILLEVYLTPPPHTVRDLASKLKVTKPVITRALDTMGRMHLLARRRDENDRRNVLVQRTVEGSTYVERLGDLLSAKVMDL